MYCVKCGNEIKGKRCRVCGYVPRAKLPVPPAQPALTREQTAGARPEQGGAPQKDMRRDPPPQVQSRPAPPSAGGAKKPSPGRKPPKAGRTILILLIGVIALAVITATVLMVVKLQRWWNSAPDEDRGTSVSQRTPRPERTPKPGKAQEEPEETPGPEPTVEPEQTPEPTSEPTPEPTEEPAIDHTPTPPPAEPEEAAKYTFETDSEGNAVVTGYTGSKTDLVIPSVLEGHPVTGIGDEAFRLIDMTSLTIPEGVTSIGSFAFYGCNELTSVTIPASMKSIGSYAFYKCKGLTSVTIPEGVTSIGDGVFGECIELMSMTIPASVTSIGMNPFAACTKLDSISVAPGNPRLISMDGCLFSKDKTELIAFPGAKTGSYSIPASVTSIGGGAFTGCSGLTGVTIPESVTSIGDWAFSYCNSLTSVTIPNSVTHIGESAFDGCGTLSSVTIPASVTEFSNTFFMCVKLMSVTIADGVTDIGEEVFQECSRLISIMIPASVTNIELWAFSDCRSLQEICVSDENARYCSMGGVLFSKDKSELIAFPRGKTGSCSIPEGVTRISEGAFYCSSELTSVTIPGSVTSIGSYAFDYCKNLTSVTIPVGLTIIGDEAFWECSSLRDVYYGGTQKQWSAIIIGEDNEALTGAAIHYSEPTVTSITLNREELTLSEPGDTFQLTASISPPEAETEILWTSLDPSVATVDENGLVTAVDKGTTRISAAAGDVTRECVVQVTGSVPTPADPGSWLDLSLYPYLKVVPDASGIYDGYKLCKVSISGELNMRTGPDTAYERVGTIPDGSTVGAVGRVEGTHWYLVYYGGKLGWVSGNYLVTDSGSWLDLSRYPELEVVPGEDSLFDDYVDYVVINTEELNMRTGPDAAYGKLGTIPEGTRIGAAARKEGTHWYLVFYEGKFGWVSGNYLTKAAGSWLDLSRYPELEVVPDGNSMYDDYVYYVISISSADAVNVRSGPDDAYRKLGTIPDGISVGAVAKEAGHWYLVFYNGKFGWVSGNYLIKDLRYAPTSQDPPG